MISNNHAKQTKQIVWIRSKGFLKGLIMIWLPVSKYSQISYSNGNQISKSSLSNCYWAANLLHGHLISYDTTNIIWFPGLPMEECLVCNLFYSFHNILVGNLWDAQRLLMKSEIKIKNIYLKLEPLWYILIGFLRFFYHSSRSNCSRILRNRLFWTKSSHLVSVPRGYNDWS